MKSYKIVITQPASQDLLEIARYSSNELREPATARKIIGRIKEAVMSLAEMPIRHALVADERLAARGIRKLPVETYIIFYVISDKTSVVTIVRILYGRRDWISLL